MGIKRSKVMELNRMGLCWLILAMLSDHLVRDHGLTKDEFEKGLTETMEGSLDVAVALFKETQEGMEP